MIRVLVADDQALVRHGFALILASDPGIDVVAAGGAGVPGRGGARGRRQLSGYGPL